MSYFTRAGFTYYAGSEQRHTRAPFLLLASSSAERDVDGRELLRAAVRSVALSQCGHFMMGFARIAGSVITVSGAFGSDGLPLRLEELSDRARECFAPVDLELARAYWADTLTAQQLAEIGRAAPTRAPAPSR